MKPFSIGLLLLAVFLQGCSTASSPSGQATADAHADTSVTHILLPVTPLKDQGVTELCWIYSALAAIESDRLAQGDSVNLSVAWIERQALRTMGINAFLAGREVSLRGTLPDAIAQLNLYGVVPYDSYRGRPHSTRVLCRRVERLASVFSAQAKDLAAFTDALDDLLDEAIGPAPENVYMLGAQYSPLEFAHSVALPGEWKAYTSFRHHPYGKSFAIEVPDNRNGREAMNVRLDTLLSMTVNSIRNHRPVMWEGCLAKLSSVVEDTNGVSAERQRLFERHKLTDDHCMTIIGMDTNADGTHTFICKNSWRGKGIVRMSQQQFLMNTIMVMKREP